MLALSLITIFLEWFGATEEAVSVLKPVMYYKFRSRVFAKDALAFQKYSPQNTVGYCSRPSGHSGCWYISTIANTKNHGPGFQQQHPFEADPNFGYDLVEPRIRSALPKDGFISDREDWVLVTKMTIMILGQPNGFVERRNYNEMSS